ncbi:esterase-like activity of phytase family protein [Paraglaciecola hydrolytica]|uniref:Phytase esterase-like protein n=1 Tax=Paraglaciecola hydrolytica TaxID=1799789 RepID=A0A136A425_9ALTE|nr:esterase-like activity of phytase family protein [Paraglaciecola hydrolytica]KXI29967.1 phytase esterase-like protein [Paraglaciecola hydrolytica]
MNTFKLSLLGLSTALVLTACGDGKDGANGNDGLAGANGSNGANGLTSLVMQSQLATGHASCWLGGVQIDSGIDINANGSLDSAEVTATSYVCNPSNFASSGVSLPYSVLRNDLENGAIPGSTFEIRNGGFGSDMDGHPTNPMQFYAITDRGPNANFSGELGAGKMFPTPDYVPRIGLFEIQATGDIKLVKTILLKDRDGNTITGLPNQAALGGTGEIPYDAAGEVIRIDPSQPYDAVTNPIKLDDYGLDSEGLVAMSDGTFWVSDEYGPHIVHYSAEGVELQRINAFAADTRNLHTLPAEFANRWANRGMEGLTITPDETTLVGIMQSSLDNPSSNRTDLTRIVTVNIATGAMSQYLYKQEKGSNSNSAIKALSATSFLVLERDGAFFNSTPTAMKHVYKIDINTATDLESVAAVGEVEQNSAIGLTIGGLSLEQIVKTNAVGSNTAAGWEILANNGITPANKTSLVVNMVNEVSYPHDKMEGLWILDNHRLAVINDDDFATWSTNDVLEQKYLDDTQSRIDSNTLYIIDGLDLTPTQ